MSYQDKGLEPQLANFLDECAARRSPHLDVGELRAAAETLTWPEQRILATDVQELEVGRLYLPEGTGNYPLLVFFHGGGWVVGSADISDGLSRQLCVDIGCGVLSVDYPLAPEHPYPAALDAADHAVRWAIEHSEEFDCDPARVGVAGSSSGANIAAAVCLRQRDNDFRDLVAQLLIYPVTSRSMFDEQCLDQDLLYREKLENYWTLYLGDATDLRYASVLDHPSHADLPPAVLVMAEHDPLLSQGRAYVRKLTETGVKVYEQIYSGMTHGFLDFPFELKQAEFARENIALAMKKLLGI